MSNQSEQETKLAMLKDIQTVFDWDDSRQVKESILVNLMFKYVAQALERIKELEKYDIRQYIPDGDYCDNIEFGRCQLLDLNFCILKDVPVGIDIEHYQDFKKHPDCPKYREVK